jgi:hypothetical protein
MKTLYLLLFCLTWLGCSSVGVTPAAQSSSVQRIIWDDDVDTDSDAMYTASALHHYVDIGAVNVIAELANSQAPAAAPVLKVYNDYYKQSIPVGANRAGTDEGPQGWSQAIVNQFDPGDNRANYTDCITVARTALASVPDGSVNYASTGGPQCLDGLLNSPADGISSLTGQQLIKAKIGKLVVMGGHSPNNPSAEFNFSLSSTQWNDIFTKWTTQNGFSPVYLVSFEDGAAGSVGVPASFPNTNPSKFAAPHGNRPFWDMMAVYYAAIGDPGNVLWNPGTDGTNAVDPNTGVNAFSTTTASGHYYLSNLASTATYNALWDGQYYHGACSFLPLN